MYIILKDNLLQDYCMDILYNKIHKFIIRIIKHSSSQAFNSQAAMSNILFKNIFFKFIFPIYNILN